MTSVPTQKGDSDGLKGGGGGTDMMETKSLSNVFGSTSSAPKINTTAAKEAVKC